MSRRPPTPSLRCLTPPLGLDAFGRLVVEGRNPILFEQPLRRKELGLTFGELREQGIASFAEDVDGELYVVSLNDGIFKIVARE